MKLKTSAIVAVMALAFIGGCPPQDANQDGNQENPLQPRLWAQMHGNAENSGFNAVHTTFALAPLKKWTASVGELAYSGPVVGPDGGIYVGNVSGEVVALNPDGSQRWRRQVDQSILASPAVNRQTGDVFVIGQSRTDTNRLTSHLFRLNSTAALLAVSEEPFLTPWSPKLWGDFVFVPSGHDLLVFDQASLILVGRVSADCFNLVCGAGPDVVGALVEFATCVVTLNTSSVVGLTDCLGEHYTLPSFPILEASTAIVDSPDLVGDPNQPFVVIVTDQCAAAFRFHPAGDAPAVGTIDRHFEVLWGHPLVKVDCDFDTLASTAPAVVLGGQVIVGDQNGRVLSLDLFTGKEIWSRNLDEYVTATPVAALRQIYVVADAKMAVLDSDGDLLSESPLQGFGRGAALSLDFVYVTTTSGVHTFALDPANGSAFDGSLGNQPYLGAAVPALGEDGTLYVSTPDGFVHAYAPQGTLARQVAIPTVAWQTPTDGATLSYAAGQALAASVSGAGGGTFDGTVTFASDVDGALCDADASATCATTSPLSLGAHQLTVFANDSSGGTNSAVISVQVVDTPPTVSITLPAESASFLDSDTLTFSATVVDPEEPNFPPEHVAWTSDIAGELGTGLTFTRRLGAGHHTIIATATDEHGQTGQASVHVEVSGDTAPTVNITEPSDGARFFDDDTITFTATVADPEQPTFPADQVVWRSDIAGDLGTGLTLQRALAAGDHTITVKATDAQGLSGEASVHVHVVVNTPPTITITAPLEGDVFSDLDLITFTATVIDPDEPDFPPDQVRWQSDLAGDLGTGLTLQRKLPVGEHTITATATDARGASGAASVHIRVDVD
jgi:outer membrane protein assembly factor BamB